MDLYEQIPIEIISVDSVQIYKKLDIGSGKPSKEVLKAFPHEMIDILECSESYSTAKFQTDCLACIKKAFDANKIPESYWRQRLFLCTLSNQFEI